MRRALFVLVAALGLGIVPLGSAESSYSDTVGDSGAAPDLRVVTISNTDSGVITVHVRAGLSPNSWISVLFAPATLGVETNGGKYFAVGAEMKSDGSLTTFVYDRPGMVPIGIPVEATASAEALTLAFAAAPFGIEDGFNFRMSSWSNAPGATYGDAMPDGSGVWYYAMTKPAPPAPPAPVAFKPVIADPTTLPTKAVAGKRFTVSFKVTRSDTGAPLMSGKMTCDPSVAGKVFRHAESFKGGTARLSFVTPRSAKGKLLKVKLTIKAGSGAATKVATFKVK